MITDPIGVLSSLLVLSAVAGPGLLLSRRAGVFPQASTGFGLHLFVALTMYFSLGLWAPDAMAYDDVGEVIHRMWTEGYSHPPVLTAGKEGYPHILAVLYTVFGHHPFLGVALNVALSPWLIGIVATTARRTQMPISATAWITALLPPCLLWGSLGLREALSWVLLAVVALGLTSMTVREEPAFSDWVLVVSGLLGMVAIRGTMAVIVAAAVGVAIIPISKNKVLPTLVSLGMAVVAGPTILSQADRLAGGYGIKEVNQVRGALAREGSSSFEVATYSGSLDVLAASPGLFLRALLGPFPWEWPSVGPIFMLDGIIWLTCVGLLFLGVRRVPKATAMAYLMPALGLILVLALTSGNYGTMQRLRIQALIVVLPLIGRGWVALRDIRQRRKAKGATREVSPRRHVFTASKSPKRATSLRTPEWSQRSPRRGARRPSPPALRQGASRSR